MLLEPTAQGSKEFLRDLIWTGPRLRGLRRPWCDTSEPVAQSVEHVTFNHGVVGSNPAGLTTKIKDLSVSAARPLPRKTKWEASVWVRPALSLLNRPRKPRW